MPRTPARNVARALTAGVAVTALCLLVASPASAHTGNIYTYLFTSDAGEGFATIDQASGVAVALPTSASSAVSGAIGVEVFQEVGTAIVERLDPEGFFVVNWNHSTGAEEGLFPLTLADSVITDVAELDTLANGTTITYVDYVDSSDTERSAIVSVAANGELEILIDLTPLYNEKYRVSSLATDPVTGNTYAFLYTGSGVSYSAILDFAAPGSYHGLGEMTGAGFEDGEIKGSDFDHNGTLHLMYHVFGGESLTDQLSTVAPNSDPTLAVRVGVIPVAIGVAKSALTVEYTEPVDPTAPVLPASGAELPVGMLAVAGVAVLGGVGALVISRRRRRV